MNRLVPGSISIRQLDRALAKVVGAIGSDWVITSGDKLQDYRDPFPFDDAFDAVPAAVVAPQSVAEIQAILKIANEHRIPLWTVSRGRNLGYGGAAPRVSGSVVLDLQRMNRVLEVSDELGYALIEPGVSFLDLYAFVRQHDRKVWLSVPGLGWGSVIGNSLERGFGYTPYGEHWANQCGMEVVLANGDVIRTGMGAMSNSTAWQLYKPGFGPSPDGLFSQSNLGIVTKMGVWMMPRPDCYMPCTAKFHDEAALAPLIDALRPLRLDGTLQGTAVVSSPIHGAAKTTRRSDWYDDDGAIPDEIIANEMLPKLNLGWWNLSFALYGPEELVDARFKIIGKALSGIPNFEMATRKYSGDVSEDDLDPADRIRAGVPGLAALEATKWAGGGGGTMAFSPISPFTGRDAMAQYQMVRRRGREFGFDYYGSFNGYTRHISHIYQIFFDRDDERQRRKLRDLFALLVKEAADQGYGEYRAHLGFMDLIADQFDFNDHALRRFTETLKDALDPNGILSPGKQGIWPASMRSASDAPASTSMTVK